jgi:hypothetical protein
MAEILYQTDWLEIENCPKLVGSREEWGLLQSLTSLMCMVFEGELLLLLC